MRRTAAVTGALLVTATMLTACGGGSGVPEVDAVAETWEERGSEFRQDICRSPTGTILRETRIGGVYALTEATIEDHPDEYLDEDVLAAAEWFLLGDKKDEIGLFLDRGFYGNRAVLAERQASYDELNEELDLDDNAEDELRLEVEESGISYLGQIDPVPDPCADSDD